jgi:hypothetical protein
VAIGAPNARADSIEQWTLSDVTFTDGGTAAGTFDFDTTTETFSNVALTLNDVIDDGQIYDFSTADFVSVNLALTQVCFQTPSFVELCIGSSVPFSTVQPTNSLALAGATEFDMIFAVSGDLSSVAVSAPEPRSFALMLLGIGLVFVMRKRISQGLSRSV